MSKIIRINPSYKEEKKIPLFRAFIWIFLITVVLSGSSWMGYFYFQYIKASRMKDPRFFIEEVVLKGKGGVLDERYLLSLIGLDKKKSQNFYAFSVKEAEDKILSLSFISSVEIKKIYPSKVFIHYQLREPIAIVEDYQNRVMDKNGRIFSAKPFMTTTSLPKIYLAKIEEEKERKVIDSVQLNLFLDLKKELEKNITSDDQLQNVHFHNIDLRDIFTPSLGKQKILLTLDNEGCFFVFLFSLDRWKQEIKNGLSIVKYIKDKFVYQDRVEIDLRLEHLGYISLDH